MELPTVWVKREVMVGRYRDEPQIHPVHVGGIQEVDSHMVPSSEFDQHPFGCAWWQTSGAQVHCNGWNGSWSAPSPPPPPVVLRRVSRHARRSNNPQAGVGCGEQIIAPRHPDTPGIAVDHTLTEGISHDIEQEEHHQQWIRR